MKAAVTSSDVAALAGVSQSTVSRAFTPGASISAKMRKKIEAAADELGYRPNAIARSLITNRSRLIGIALAYLDNPYYPVALEKLGKRLQAEGYHTMIFFADNVRPADELVAKFLDYRVDAVVLASVALSTDWAEACERAGVPVVLFNRGHSEKRFSAVTSANRNGGERAARFLIDGGHRRIAYIAGWSGASTQRDREAGFLRGLEAHGRSLFARGAGDFYDMAKTRAATLELFDCPTERRPDAVFVCNDHMAFTVMDVLRFELGLLVPGDVSVLGYDDVPLAASPAYALTSVRQSVNRMVEATLGVLTRQLDRRGATPDCIEIEGPLMVRNSARIPKGYMN